MVKITLNLRNKYIFFALSLIGMLYLLYHINMMSWSIDLTAWDRMLYFLISIFTAGMFWIPYQFTEQFA